MEVHSMRSLSKLFVLLTLVAVPSLSHAQPAPAAPADRGEAKLSLAGKSLAIEYGRPSLRGRDMLGQAAVGQVWRMGSGGATTLKTDADLSFGTAAIPKGSYVLTAKKVSEDQWTLLVSQGEKVVQEVPLAGTKLADSVETFTIELRGAKNAGEFEMRWGTAAFKAPFTVK
jgi:hypothetical protein